MQRKLFIIILLLAVFIGFSCNPTEPPLKIPLSLSIEDVSCTEAWLKLKADNAYGELTVTRDQSKTIAQLTNPGTIDTIIYIDSLLPNKTYTFQAVLTENKKLIGTSDKIIAKTLDTTSHDFTWETFTFGGGGEASFIWDASIIDENNIWVCGEIYLPDSLGNPDDNLYNAIHWDGNIWMPKRISAEFRGNIITLPLDGVFTFSATDLWFVGSLPIHGDGNNWRIFDIRTTTDLIYRFQKPGAAVLATFILWEEVAALLSIMDKVSIK